MSSVFGDYASSVIGEREGQSKVYVELQGWQKNWYVWENWILKQWRTKGSTTEERLSGVLSKYKRLSFLTTRLVNVIAFFLKPCIIVKEMALTTCFVARQFAASRTTIRTMNYFGYVFQRIAFSDISLVKENEELKRVWASLDEECFMFRAWRLTNPLTACSNEIRIIGVWKFYLWA